MTQYFAHSANKAGSEWEPLKEHISCVAKRAGEYADPFGAKQEAIIAGLWHDVGKGEPAFQRKLQLYMVSISQYAYQKHARLSEEILSGVYYWRGQYHEQLGVQYEADLAATVFGIRK